MSGFYWYGRTPTVISVGASTTYMNFSPLWREMLCNSAGEWATRVGAEQTITAEAANHYKSFPSAVLCGDGTVLCAYRDGTSSQDNTDCLGGNIYLARYSAATWGTPWLLYEKASETNQWQAGMLARLGGRIFLYARVGDSTTPPNHSHIWVSYSDNDGATFSAQVEMTPPSGFYRYSAFGEHACKFTVTTAGLLLMTAYGKHLVDDTLNSTACLQSPDGLTWTLRSWIAEGGIDAATAFNEASLARLADGRILAVTRNTDNLMRQAHSSDEGLTWTDPVLVGGGAGIAGNAPVLHVTTYGSVFLTYRSNASSVALLRSLDCGATWAAAVTVQAYTYSGGYSEMVEDGAGLLHVIYFGDDASHDPWIREHLLSLYG